MLQYLIILLDDTSTSYCHYAVGNKTSRLISIDDLRKGIFFAMKENLMIQFVYPDYPLPQEYVDVIDTIDHSDIVSSACKDEELLSIADVIVYNGWDDLNVVDDSVCVLRTTKANLFCNYKLLPSIIDKAMRLNIVITDIESFTDADFKAYQTVLKELSNALERSYADGKSKQLNLLTDRMMLDKMNNCNAGVENITLAPDGRFYICPAFYLAGDDEDYGLGKSKFNIGDLEHGLNIKNQQLYRLDHAPLCRRCDAYQCKRCVWLNRKTTYEVNTPSHEQCVVAHVERNASRELLLNIRKHGVFLPNIEIREITHLDPFEMKEKI